MGNALHRAYGETIVSIEEFEEESLLEKTLSLLNVFFERTFNNICRLLGNFKSMNKEQK